MFLEIVLISIGLVTVFWFWINKKYSYWESQGIDCIPGVFPFGSLKECFLLKRNIGEVFAEYYREHNDKRFVGFYAPFDAMLLVRDPELIRTILVKDYNSFSSTGFTVRKDIDPLLGYNPFGEGEFDRWKASRNVTSPALALNKIKIMTTDMIKSAENLSKYIATKIGEPIEMKTLTRNYLIDAVVSSAFGIESNLFDDNSSTFREFTKGEMFADSSDANFSALTCMFIPFVNRIFRWRTLSKNVEKVFLNMQKSCVEHRQKSGITRPDILQHLINLNDKAEQENRKPFSDIEMAAHCVSIYGDGVDTASLAMSAGCYYLAGDSRVQEKLRTEIHNAIKDLKDLDFDKLQSLEYLDMVVTEIMRLHPPVPFLSRRCTQTTNLDEVKILKDSKVFIPTLGLHRDPKYYPEPEKFLPERFSKEKRAELHKFVYLPFSEGPRMCLGFRYAQTEIKVGLVAIFLKYRMTLAKRMNLETDEGTIFLMSPKGDINVIFTPV